MRNRSYASVAAGAILVAVLGTPGSAQSLGSQRPFKGLFGGAGGIDSNSSARHLLSLSLSLSEAFDSDTPAELDRTVSDPSGLQVDGFSTRLDGGLEYAWRGKRAAVGASSQSAIRYEADSAEFRTLSHSVGLGVSARLSKGATFFANQTAAYSPWYLYSLFPSLAEISAGDALPAAPDFSVSKTESYAYRTTLSFSQAVTPRSRVTARGGYAYTDFLEETLQRQDLDSRSVSLSFDRQLAPSTALSVGYRYRVGNFGYVTQQTSKEHGFDVRFDHARRLSATRRAYVSLNIGSSVSDVPLTPDDETLEEERGVIGSASFGYDFGRSWQGRATYRRGVEFLAGLPGPVRTEGVTTALTGLVSSRFDLTASAAYSDGEGAMRRAGQSFKTYTTGIKGRFGLTRTLAGYADYLYYLYDFTEGVVLLPGLPPRFTRHGVRVGITLWVPLLER